MARTGAANPFSQIHVGNYSTPAAVDMNGDGKKDLLVGSGNAASDDSCAVISYAVILAIFFSPL